MVFDVHRAVDLRGPDGTSDMSQDCSFRSFQYCLQRTRCSFACSLGALSGVMVTIIAVGLQVVGIYE